MPENFRQTTLSSPLALFDRVVASVPERAAVVARATSLTFQELDRAANGLARLLTAWGVHSGDRVGLRCAHTAELPVAITALWRIGAAYLPLSPDDPPARVRALIERVPTAAVLDCTPDDVLPDALTYMVADGLTSDEPPTAALGVGDRAYTMFTSGSTGTPRAVDITHTSLAHLWSGLDDFLSRAAAGLLYTVALNAPHTFDASVKQLLHLFAGRTLYMIDDAARQDPITLLATLSTAGVDLLDVTPSHLRLLMAADPTLAGMASTFLLIGGEAIDAALLDALTRSRVGGFAGVYGLTECCVDSAAAMRDELPSLGRPLPGVDVWICAPDGHAVAPGDVGEIVIGGWGTAAGYADGADDEHRFAARPDGMPGPAFRTGDFGWQDPAGLLRFAGRRDEQVKVGGRRASTAEVVDVLRRAPSVAAAAVVPDDTGLGLRAAVVPLADPGQAVAEAREQAARWLPPYLRPVEIVAVPRLPLNRHGKIDRTALLAVLSDGLATPEGPSGSPIELALARFRAALGREDVGPDDNYFQLGGDSIGAVRMLRGLEKDTGLSLGLVRFIGKPTPRHLAGLLGDSSPRQGG
jgi:amino acid adenylation domain-containing protein